MEKLFVPLDSKNLNPVVRAHNIWQIVSEQIREVLGATIHQQWFVKLVPLVISDNCLIIMAPNSFNAKWVNNHYKDLIDLMISFQDKQISGFIIDKSSLDNLESSTAKIYSNTKNNNRA